MGLLAGIGAILVVLGVIDLFIHIVTVAAIPLIIIGLVIFVVAHFTGGGTPWYRRGGPGPY